MAKSKTDMTELLGLMIIVIIALALTPTIASSCVDAQYTPFTENKIIVSSVSNSTSALTHPARNDSATYAWFTITLDQESEYGSTIVDVAKNITYTVATKIILFKPGLFDNTKTYNCTIAYYWMSLGAAEKTLIGLVPLFWVTLIIAAVVVFIVYKLKFR